MKPDWNRRFAAGLLAILLCLCSFSMPAFASGSDPAPEPLPKIVDEEPTTGGMEPIVELNPISCSMCYVNNSIYADVVPEIGECQRQLMMGAEFCYDAIANPKDYDMLRISNKSYTYTSDNQYALL